MVAAGLYAEVMKTEAELDSYEGRRFRVIQTLEGGRQGPEEQVTLVTHLSGERELMKRADNDPEGSAGLLYGLQLNESFNPEGISTYSTMSIYKRSDNPEAYDHLDRQLRISESQEA